MSMEFSPSSPTFAPVANNVEGANTGELRTLAAYIENDWTTAIETAVNGAATQMNNTHWNGQDTEQYITEWAAMLASVAAAFNATDFAANLRAQADEQDAASAS